VQTTITYCHTWLIDVGSHALIAAAPYLRIILLLYIISTSLLLTSDDGRRHTFSASNLCDFYFYSALAAILSLESLRVCSIFYVINDGELN